MLILGIDCGTRQAGFGLLDVSKDSLKVVDVFLWRAPKHGSDIAGTPERLASFGEAVAKYTSNTDLTAVVIEELRFNKFAKNFASLGLVAASIGVAMEQTHKHFGAPIMMTATSARARVMAKNKEEARLLINERFFDHVAGLGYPKGILKAHIDISDALVLAWAAAPTVSKNERR
jgi:Holliday junction resolvasome RuvABC endonuclease subunit